MNTLEELARTDPEAATLLARRPDGDSEAFEEWLCEWELLLADRADQVWHARELEGRLRAARVGSFILDPHGFVIGLR